jgi:hypothetical protein
MMRCRAVLPWRRGARGIKSLNRGSWSASSAKMAKPAHGLVKIATVADW